MSRVRKPKPIHCAQCGADMGRGYKDHNICVPCASAGAECLCRKKWKVVKSCPVHKGRDPYDIPF